MHDSADKMRTGLYIAGGLLTANLLDAALRGEVFHTGKFKEAITLDAVLDAGILPACAAYYLIKHA